jgi:hypothetical protein
MLATSSNGGAATPRPVAQTPGGAGAAATPATAPRGSDDGAGPLRIPFRALQRQALNCGECCWEEAVCVERTELVHLQRPPNVCMLVHARAWTKTRGNPDRGMRVLLRMLDKVSDTAAGLSA